MRTIVALLYAAAAAVIPAVGLAGLMPEELTDLALDPRPAARLPLQIELVDESGNTAPLGSFFAGKPVVLVLEYLHCKTICGVALGNLAAAAAGVPQELERPYPVIAISIDPRDGPADAMAAKAKYAGGRDAGWHFLTGPEAAVRPIADAVGFRYRYDPASDQYIHSSGVIIAASDGTVSSYLTNIEVDPAQLRAAFDGAAGGQVSGPLARLLLLCFGQNQPAGRYAGLIETALVLLNLAGMLAAIGLFALVRRRFHG